MIFFSYLNKNILSLSMNTDLLRTFIEVSKTRHFGRAAENLCLTQSAVSFRIKQLEESVGVPLFSRQRNNILLTRSGEQLLPHAENILASWQIALQDVGVSASQDRQLTLGSTSNLWDTFLQSTLPKVATTFPGLNIRTEINPQQDLTRALLNSRVDVAVMLDPPKVADLILTKIGRIELVLVSDKQGMRASDLPELGHIFVDWGTSVNFQQAKLFTTPTAPILHTGQSHIALEFLTTNGGAAFLPKALVLPFLNTGKLFHVGKIKPLIRDVFAVYSNDTSRSKIITPLIEMLKEVDLKPAHHAYS